MHPFTFLSIIAAMIGFHGMINAQNTCPLSYSLTSGGVLYSNTAQNLKCTPNPALSVADQCYTVTSNGGSATGTLYGCSDVAQTFAIGSNSYTLTIPDIACSSVNTTVYAVGGFTYSYVVVFCNQNYYYGTATAAASCTQSYSLTPSAGGSTYSGSSTCTPSSALSASLQCYTVTTTSANGYSGFIMGCTDVANTVVINGVSSTLTLNDWSCSNPTNSTVQPGFTGYNYSNTQVACTVGQALNLAGLFCFSQDSQVETQERGMVSIGEIHPGEHVKAYDLETSSVIFSKFVSYSHEEAETLTRYVSIQTASKRHLKISEFHLIVKVNPSAETEFVYASELKLNDILLDADLNMDAIVSLDVVYDKGAYAPMTEAGTIIVNNVVASCYANFRSHNFAHFAMPILSSLGQMVNSFLGFKDTTEMAHGINVYSFFDSLYQAFPMFDSFMVIRSH
jgi:hypothetical protein